MNIPRRLRRPPRGYTKQQLNDWLDEQELIIQARALPAEIMEEFDPLYNPQLAGELHEVYDPGDEKVEEGRRTILFTFTMNLESSIDGKIQRKLAERVTRFMLKISSLVELRNTITDDKLSYYQTIGNSPWFEALTAARNWLTGRVAS